MKLTQESARSIKRTNNCGELNLTNSNQKVVLCGWVAKWRDHGGLIFIDLRDRFGVTQVVFDPAISGDAHAKAGVLRSEFCIAVSGLVRARPDGMMNPNIATGSIEVIVSELKIFSESITPPFALDEETNVAETVRLKHRYLDLRRPNLQKNLKMRSDCLRIVRNHLHDHGFLEIETPILYKSTPEGARDFVVPSRLNQGQFYALPQSPQILKQLLMVSGMDRYYQIARCFRDEDLRADRQPEFTQIDLEVSFLDEAGLFPILEKMIVKLWKELLGIELKTPFPQMSYDEAMRRYGSDKPDVRFDLCMQDITSVFDKSEFQVFQKSKAIHAICIEPKEAQKLSRKNLDDLQKVTQAHGGKGLLWIRVQENGEWQSPAAKFLSELEKKSLQDQLSMTIGSLVLIVADSSLKKACTALGAVRLALGELLNLVPPLGQGEDHFLWVTEFPLLEFDEKEKRYFACHHPFTSPRPQDEEKLLKGEDLENLKASAYDLVLNGVEIGGGSLRIFSPEIQAALFKVLGMSEEEVSKQFGFFIDALKYGTPPHGGLAFGVERLAAILSRVGPIRDVMAFPKTQSGSCLMSDAPSLVSQAQLSELGIRVQQNHGK